MSEGEVALKQRRQGKRQGELDALFPLLVLPSCGVRFVAEPIPYFLCLKEMSVHTKDSHYN